MSPEEKKAWMAQIDLCTNSEELERLMRKLEEYSAVYVYLVNYVHVRIHDVEARKR